MSLMSSLVALLKPLHVSAVVVSGCLFAVRGAFAWAGFREQVMAPPLRYLSYAIDTVLLAAGIGLAVAFSIDPFSSPWLGAKLLLLLGYFVLGSLALKRGRTRRIRRVSYLGALVVYLLMIGIARSHDPLIGWTVTAAALGFESG